MAEGLICLLLDPHACQPLITLVTQCPNIRQSVLDLSMRMFRDGWRYIQSLGDADVLGIESGFETFSETVLIFLQFLNPGKPFDHVLSDIYSPYLDESTGIYPRFTASGSQSFLNVMLSLRAFGPVRVGVQHSYYFEHLNGIGRGRLCSRFATGVMIDSQQSLDDLSRSHQPCVIVTDIRTNDSTQPTDANLPITQILQAVSQRRADQQTVIVLDITTVSYLHPDVLACIKAVKSHPNMLLVLVTSLAKVVQFGGDRLTGGATIVIGNNHVAKAFMAALDGWHHHTPMPASSERMFAFLHGFTAQLLLQRYPDLGTQANALYQELILKLPLSTRPVKSQVGLTVGERTHVDGLFVSLHTTGLAEAVQKHISGLPIGGAQERLAIIITHLLYLRLAPLGATRRMSFGFSSAAITDAGTGIRISVGEADISGYADQILTLHRELGKIPDDQAQLIDLGHIMKMKIRDLRQILNQITDSTLSVAQVLAALSASKLPQKSRHR
jgi:hypothetical protein